MGNLLEDRKGWNQDISPVQTLSVATQVSRATEGQW
jgi:hypothetical protein